MDNFLHSCRIFAEKNKDMEPQEYYRLYPELRRRRWYGSLPVRAVMNYIVRNAFARPCRVFDIDLSAGSLITFYSSLAEATHLDFWQVKRALNQLNDEGDLSITPSGLNMILTLTHFPLQTQPQPKELTGTEVGAQYIAPAHAAQSNKLNRKDVGTLFKAPAQPEQTFTTESTVPESSPTNPNKLTSSKVGAQYTAPAQPEQTSTTESTVSESSPTNLNELTRTEVGAQYIAPAQAAQSNKLNRKDVGTLFKASAEPEQTFTTESSVPLNPPRKKHHFHSLRRKAPKKSRIRGDTIVGTGVSPCKSTAHLHKPRSGDIFIRSPSY